MTPKTEFKAAGDVALLAASPTLEHAPSANWSEKNEKVLQDWKLEVANKIKECEAEAKQQVSPQVGAQSWHTRFSIEKDLGSSGRFPSSRCLPT